MISRLLQDREVDRDTGCWIWTGSWTPHGYGIIWWQGEPEFVHRVAAHLFLNFDLDSGEHVYHTTRGCVRACYNTDHLAVGTLSEARRFYMTEMEDKWRKRRLRKQLALL